VIVEYAMKVDLVAWTEFDPRVIEEATGWSTDATGAEALIEAAGRACYESWSKPNPATATNAGYIANILDHKHFSVLEHSQATFWIRGVSRNFSHEMIRHRHFSYSELSQRFVPVEKLNYVMHPTIAQHVEGDIGPAWDAGFDESRDEYRRLEKFLKDEGLTVKECREAARSVLPGMTETRLFVTGNFRAWREFITKRSSIHADAEIRHVANTIAGNLKVRFPNAFQDMKLRFPENKAVWQFVKEEKTNE
jgi:thymidylate synthase, flavin-dependent